MSVKKKVSNHNDAIIIEGLKSMARVGVTKQERSRPQPLTLTITLYRSLKLAGISDQISNTVNYLDVALAVREFLFAQSFHLIESIAHEVSELILDRFSVTAVKVQVFKKPFPFAKHVSVSIFRHRRRSAIKHGKKPWEKGKKS